MANSPKVFSTHFLRYSCNTLIVFTFLATEFAFASIAPPSGPSSSPNGTYDVAYPFHDVDRYCDRVRLQERADSSSNWVFMSDPNYDGVVEFINKFPGVYHYRSHTTCEDYYGEYSWEEYSSTITITAGQVPTVDPIDEQLFYEYEVRFDGGQKFFIKRLTPADRGNGTIEKIILVSSSGPFSSYVPTDAEAEAANSWSVVPIDVTVSDVDVNGFVDLILENVDSFVTGATDQLVFAPGAIYETQASSIVAIDQDFREFAADMTNYFIDPNYFYKNEETTETRGYYRTYEECEWVYYPYQGWEIECETHTEWVEGEEITTYPGIHRDAVTIWEAISRGDYGAVKGKLKSVFGIEIGGGQWCPDFGLVANSNECVSLEFELVWSGLADTLTEPQSQCSATLATSSTALGSIYDRMKALIDLVRHQGRVVFQAVSTALNAAVLAGNNVRTTVTWGLKDIATYNTIYSHVTDPKGSVIPWQDLRIEWSCYGAPKQSATKVLVNLMNDAN